MPISLSIRLGLGSNSGVSILGAAQVGTTLGLSAIYLNGDGPDLTYRAQWLSVASTGTQTPIQGAVGASYTVGYVNAGLGIRAMLEDPSGEIIYSQIVNIPATQPAPMDALAVAVTPHPTDPALIRIVFNGPMPANGGSAITAVRRERRVAGVSQGTFHLRQGGALPVVGGVYDVPGQTGVDNDVYIWAANATSGAPNKGSPHTVVPGSTIPVPGAVTSLTVTPGDAQNTVTFAAPASGGAAVDYLIEVTTDGVTYATVATILAAGPLSQVHTGLTNGTTYTYRVTARNSGGAGAAATASGTPAAPAVAPTITAEASVVAADLGASIRYTYTNPTATGTDPITIAITAATLDGVDVLSSFSGLSIAVSKTALDQTLAVTFTASNAAGDDTSTVTVTVPATVTAATVNITEAASDRFEITPSAGTLTLPLAGTTNAADDADIEVRLIERFRRGLLTGTFASTRAAVLALKTDLTTNGIGSAVLQPVSSLAGTAGLTINTGAKTVTVATGALVMVSYINFDGWKIIGNAGSHLIAIYCLMGNPGNGAMGGNFAIDLYPGSVATGVPGARFDAYFCSLESSGTGSNALQTLIKVRVNDNGVSVAPTTNLFHCRLAGYTSDSFKPVRGRVEFCYIDPAVTSPGAHADLVTVPACDPAVGVQFRACYFNQDSAARGAGYTSFPTVTDGVNNILRLGPGAGGIAQTAFGQVLVSECIFERDPNTVSKSFQFVESSGVTVTAPQFVNNKWVKDDVSASRWYPNETTPIEWGNNLTPADATTSPPAAGTPITAPSYTAPGAWSDLDVRAIIDWVAAGVALSGAWTASLTFPTTPFDIVVSARVAGSAAVDTAAYTYRAEVDPGSAGLTGQHVFAFMGQSNIEYLMARTGAYVSASNTYPSGVDTENVRIVLGGGASETIDDFLVTDAVMVAKNINLGTAAVAEFLAWRYPSADFILLDLAVSGTGRIELQNDANTARNWSTFAALVNHVNTNYGNKPDVVFEFWTSNDGAWIPTFGKNFAPLYFGEMWSGAAFTLGGQNTESNPAYTTPVDHCFWDNTAATLDAAGRGIFTRTGTKIAFSRPGGAGHEDSVCMDSGFRAFIADPRVQYFRQASDITPNMQIGIHSGGHALIEPDGQVKFAQGMLMPAILRHTGDYIRPPSIIGYEMGPANAYCDIIFDLPHGGDLTTIGALEGRAALSSSMPARQDVYGIRILRSADATSGANLLDAGFPLWNTAETGKNINYRGTAVIQDAGTGVAPSRTGRVRVTPAVAFAAGDRLYTLHNEQVVDGDPSGLSANESSFKPWTRYPIEHVPDLYNASAHWPFWGFAPLLRPEPHIVGSTPPSTPADFWTQVSGGPRFTDTANLPTGCFRLKWSARMRLTDTGRQTGMAAGENTILSQGGKYLEMVLRNDANYLYLAVNTVNDSSGTGMLPSGVVTIARPFPLNRWFDVAVDINLNARTLVVSIDGAAVSTTTLNTGTGLFATASNRRLSLNGSGAAAMNAGVNFDFVQIETDSGSGLTTRKLLSGTAASVNADGWKVVGSGDAI